MPFVPSQVLGIWFRGLCSVLLLGAGIYLVEEWYRRSDGIDQRPSVIDAQPGTRDVPMAGAQDLNERNHQRSRWQLAFDRETAMLLGGLALVLWSCGGGWSLNLLRRNDQKDAPRSLDEGEVRFIDRPDGTRLHVRSYGPATGSPVVLVHGWGLDLSEWTYAQHELAAPIRLIVWDLPGLGRSRGPANKDWSLDKLAGDLDAVLRCFPGQPAVLVGHSIGGMIVLTYCRLFPKRLKQRVRGIVIAQSTYTNPVKTTSSPRLHSALQKPVLEPLCHLMVWLAPFVWLLNCLSYANGSAHRSTHKSFFSGNETRAQLNFISRYYVTAWPAVVARGMLAMLRYDATAVLPAIDVPSLIIAGDKDTTCTPEASIYMSKTIPKGAIYTLVSSRHGGLFEHHEQFAEVISSFMTITAPSSAETDPATA